MDKTDVIYLYFCNAFDMVQANIPVGKLEQYRFDGWRSSRIRNKGGWSKFHSMA